MAESAPPKLFEVGKDAVLSSAPPTQLMQRHTTSHSKIKIREALQWGSSDWEAEACTPQGLASLV